MLDLTYLSPRESFLLGLCLGEYESKRSSDPEARFISVIRDRLIPFIDTLGQSVTSYLTLDQIPTDVAWRNCNGWNWGRAKSQPDTVYNCFGTIESEVPYAGSITAHSWRPGRKSLIELLIHSLSPFMCMSLKDHFSFGDSFDPTTIATEYFEYWSSYAFQGHEVADAKTNGKKEIPAAIRRTLDEQINKCGDERLFGIGKLLGLSLRKSSHFQTGLSMKTSTRTRNIASSGTLFFPPSKEKVHIAKRAEVSVRKTTSRTRLVSSTMT